MNTIKIFSVLIVFFSYITDVFSQNCGLTEKETINGMILYKAWSKNTKERMILLSNNPKQMDGEECYYFDSDGNLRKIISWSEYPESIGVIIAYYNDENELMYLIFSDFQPEGYSCQGIAYKKHRGKYSDNIVLKYKVQNKEMVIENIYVQKNADEYPVKIGDLWLSQYFHVDSLKSYKRIETLQPPPNCKKVQFVKPTNNQMTFTNSHNINLRKEPNVLSKVIRIMEIGNIVRISDVLQEETIKGIGTYHWYKIEFNQIEGYIFGAFLEPVEEEINE